MKRIRNNDTPSKVKLAFRRLMRKLEDLGQEATDLCMEAAAVAEDSEPKVEAIIMLDIEAAADAVLEGVQSLSEEKAVVEAVKTVNNARIAKGKRR